MQYELYIDVFFLVNFMMDYLVLHIVRKALKCTATHGSVLLGALAGALASSVIICIPIPAFIKLICLHTLVNTIMVIIGLKIREIRTFWKALILIYLTCFMLGGVMTWLEQYLGGYVRIGSLFFAITICSYFLVSKGLDFLEFLWKIREYRCEVTLHLNNHTYRAKAMIDSGNGLYDVLTGKPVHIIGQKAIKKLTENEKIQKVRYIPYHTIQKSDGILPIITIDKMYIHGKTEKVVDNPLLGISEKHLFNNGTCEMILHPDDC